MFEIAVKPKYATRKAVDKVIFNEDKLLTIIEVNTKRQILSLFDTSFVAYIKDGEYYPVDVDNYSEQYDLIDAGETPTVDADSEFGIKKLENFFTASESEICSQIQEDVEVYNAIVRATLVKVTKFENLGDSNIDKNGYWFIVAFDKTKASAEGYSDIKFFDSGEELVDGDNYIFMGNTPEEVSARLVSVKATLTDGEASSEVEMKFDCKIKVRVNFPKDEIPAISVNGREYSTLKAAFESIPNGGIVEIAKSFEEPKALIALNSGADYTIVIKNNTTATLGQGIEVLNGHLTITGNGTMKEKTPSRAPIILNNTNADLKADVFVDSGITLEGKIGLFFTKASHNLSAICKGNLIGGSEGYGFYANGNVLNGSFALIDGSAVSTEGLGVYIAGNIDTIIQNSKISGTESGLEIRAGSLMITDSRIECSSEEEPTMKPNGSGTTSTACAVAVAQHSTKHEIFVNLGKGNTLIAKAAFMEGNPQQTPSATEDTHITIEDGTFVGLIKTLTPETDCTKFLYGGVYSEEPDASFVADGFKVISRGDAYEIVPMNEKDFF